MKLLLRNSDVREKTPSSYRNDEAVEKMIENAIEKHEFVIKKKGCKQKYSKLI